MQEGPCLPCFSNSLCVFALYTLRMRLRKQNSRSHWVSVMTLDLGFIEAFSKPRENCLNANQFFTNRGSEPERNVLQAGAPPQRDPARVHLQGAA